MGISSEEGEDRRMEGWLYLVRSNRLGLQYSRKRYFVLEGNALNCYKHMPSSSGGEEPIRSAVIDSCIRVADNGRENIHGNVFFVFTLYNASNHKDQLKTLQLGARSSEEAARWIRSLMDAALKECPNKEENVVACSKRRWQPFRLSRRNGRNQKHSIGALSSAKTRAKRTDAGAREIVDDGVVGGKFGPEAAFSDIGAEEDADAEQDFVCNAKFSDAEGSGGGRPKSR